MLHVIHKLKIQFHPRGRDNVKGTILGPGNPEYSEEVTERLYCSFVALPSLHFDSPDPPKSYTSEKFRDILNLWSAMDVHYNKDDVDQADFTNNVAGHGIAARN
jgi:hypothetical protein